MPNNEDGYDVDKYDLGAYKDYIKPKEEGTQSRGGNENGGSNKLIPLLLFIIVLLVAGIAYFLGRGSASSEVISSSEKKPNRVAETEPKVVTNEETPDEKQVSNANTIATQVKNAAASTHPKGKMSQAEIAAIVQMVITKMDKKKKETNNSAARIAAKITDDTLKDHGAKVSTATKVNSHIKAGKIGSESKSAASTQDQSQDNDLIASLSDTEVDTLAPMTDKAYTLSQGDKKKKASSKTAANTYNKVAIGNKAPDQDDELSRLSNEISSLADLDDTKSDTSSASTLSKAVDSNGSKKVVAAAKKESAGSSTKLSTATNKKKKKATKESGYAKAIKKEVKTRTKEMRFIVVKKGDTLGGIARKAYGDARE
ncbi:MAG TPA: hypothetical protein ENL02_04930 [Epsilonproteobacteria bacterium]|nr:hypothetical protein [Campylobacterota bacterium]